MTPFFTKYNIYLRSHVTHCSSLQDEYRADYREEILNKIERGAVIRMNAYPTEFAIARMLFQGRTFSTHCKNKKKVQHLLQGYNGKKMYIKINIYISPIN